MRPWTAGAISAESADDGALFDRPDAMTRAATARLFPLQAGAGHSCGTSPGGSCRPPQTVMRELETLHDDRRGQRIEIRGGPLDRDRRLDLPRPGLLIRLVLKTNSDCLARDVAVRGVLRPLP